MAHKKQAKKPGKAKSLSATAMHVSHEGNHLVGIGNLRVVIVQDESSWFAQGLEIDYAAQGESLDQVKKSFEDGLCWTIHEHLRVYGNIEQFLKPAPPEVWKEMLYDQLANVNHYSQFSWHQDLSENAVTNLPFARIEYLQREAQAA